MLNRIPYTSVSYFSLNTQNMNLQASHPKLTTAIGFIILLMLTGTLFIAAKAQNPNTPTSSASFSPLDHLLKDIQDRNGLQLRLIKNHDPYGVGMKNLPSAENEQYLYLTADMTFSMWDSSQKNGGHWNANGYSETLTFHCTSINGTGLTGEAASYTFEVKAYEADQVILITNGKQGPVEMVYQTLPGTERQAFQLSYGK